MGKKRKNPSPHKDKDNNIFPASSSFKRPRPSSYKYTAPLAQAHHDDDDDDNDSSSRTFGVQPRLDPTYGQRGAFPGLDDGGNGKSWAGGEEGEGEGELFYGPASDGLEYLRMVR